MKKRDGRFNPKRKMIKLEERDLEQYAVLASQVRYSGNPEHKKNPGDFGLTPPSRPRAGKSLCDSVKIFTRQEALQLLKRGLEKGLISDRFQQRWPKNIWSVTDDGIPLEAQIDSPETGSYHGYPMQKEDPFSDEVLREWGIRK